MAELFKDLWTRNLIKEISKSIIEIIPSFDSEKFSDMIFDNEWCNKEFKQRMRHITLVLKEFLTDDYEKNIDIILNLIPILKKDGFNSDSLPFAFLPDFIEVFGLDNFEISINAMEEITKFFSCEFAIRPFIIKYQEDVIPYLLKWSKHKHPMVRRLSSEGSRSRLPWGMAIPSFKIDPTPILPILENLKNDSSESVRKSVANNLNDISKDNPKIVIEIAKSWLGKRKETDWIIKHACRTLLKQGNREVMLMFGFGDISEIEITKLMILTRKIKIGESLEFNFELKNKSISSTKIRLEYAIYYQKANGTLSKKVYKISEKSYNDNSITTINRKQSFRQITTRKFHHGLHKLALVINGNELEKHDFYLVK